MPSYSGVWTLTAQYQAKGAGNWPVPISSLSLGLFAGGKQSDTTVINNISYVDIATTGNASAFGNLTQVSWFGSACGSSTRSLFGSLYDNGTSPTTTNNAASSRRKSSNFCTSI